MKKVLVLGVASVQMDAIVTLKDLGYKTFACAMAKDGPGADEADQFDIINILDIPQIIEHIRKYNIDIIYSVGSDIAMPIASTVSEMLGLPHFVSSKTATICNNKNMMRISLGKDCEGNIPFQVIENEEVIPEIELPFIIKPTDSQGQRGVFLIDSLQEYREKFNISKQYSRSGKVIVEKYIDGPEISVNSYMIEGKLCFMVASDRETWPQYTGLIRKHIVPSKVVNIEVLKRLKKVVTDACQRIGIMNGPAYFQIKLENEKPYIIEMTPRLDGCHMWKLIKYYTSVDLLKLTFRHLIERDFSELHKEIDTNSNYELEFLCQEPNTIMNKEKFQIPSVALEHFYYYKSGAVVRPVNGRFDKVGYFIVNLGE